MILDVRDLPDRDIYAVGAPSGTWRGVLEARGWGKKGNLLLFWRDLDTGARWQFAVWWSNGYKPDEEGPDFKDEVQDGDVFQLTTTKAASGFGRLKRAVAATATSPAPAADDPAMRLLDCVRDLREQAPGSGERFRAFIDQVVDLGHRGELLGVLARLHERREREEDMQAASMLLGTVINAVRERWDAASG